MLPIFRADPEDPDSSPVEPYRHQTAGIRRILGSPLPQAGEGLGVGAIRNPDIIPPDVARRAIKTMGKMLDDHFEGRLPYRLTDEGTAVGLYEIQERINGDRYLFAICQLRMTLATRQWHLYWMRKFDAWWPYPLPESGRRFTLRARVHQVLEHRWGCFFG